MGLGVERLGFGFEFGRLGFGQEGPHLAEKAGIDVDGRPIVDRRNGSLETENGDEEVGDAGGVLGCQPPMDAPLLDAAAARDLLEELPLVTVAAERVAQVGVAPPSAPSM